MSEKKRKIKYWVFKVLSILVACGVPIFAIAEHFPIWTESYGASKSLGVGGIVGIIVVLIIFRKTIFDYIREKINIKNAPPITVWIVLIAVSYILLYIAQFIRDMIDVFWMGLVGCGLGMGLTCFAEKRYGDDKENTNG